MRDAVSLFLRFLPFLDYLDYWMDSTTMMSCAHSSDAVSEKWTRSWPQTVASSSSTDRVAPLRYTCIGIKNTSKIFFFGGGRKEVVSWEIGVPKTHPKCSIARVPITIHITQYSDNLCLPSLWAMKKRKHAQNHFGPISAKSFCSIWPPTTTLLCGLQKLNRT